MEQEGERRDEEASQGLRRAKVVVPHQRHQERERQERGAEPRRAPHGREPPEHQGCDHHEGDHQPGVMEHVPRRSLPEQGSPVDRPDGAEEPGHRHGRAADQGGRQALAALHSEHDQHEQREPEARHEAPHGPARAGAARGALGFDSRRDLGAALGASPERRRETAVDDFAVVALGQGSRRRRAQEQRRRRLAEIEPPGSERGADGEVAGVRRVVAELVVSVIPHDDQRVERGEQGRDGGDGSVRVAHLATVELRADLRRVRDLVQIDQVDEQRVGGVRPEPLRRPLHGGLVPVEHRDLLDRVLQPWPAESFAQVDQRVVGRHGDAQSRPVRDDGPRRGAGAGRGEVGEARQVARVAPLEQRPGARHGRRRQAALHPAPERPGPERRQAGERLGIFRQLVGQAVHDQQHHAPRAPRARRVPGLFVTRALADREHRGDEREEERCQQAERGRHQRTPSESSTARMRSPTWSQV